MNFHLISQNQNLVRKNISLDTVMGCHHCHRTMDRVGDVAHGEKQSMSVIYIAAHARHVG
jgi:hypothetical protein